MSKRPLATSGILLLLLAVLAGWSFARLADSRTVTIAARAELADCYRSGAEIRSLRTQPTLAAGAERQSGEISRLVETAAKSAGIGAQQLIRISPQPPVRPGDGPYKEKPTSVSLKAVSTEQLVKLICHLESAPGGLICNSIRLDSGEAAPGGGGTYSCEVLLTYLIYEPANPAKE